LLAPEIALLTVLKVAFELRSDRRDRGDDHDRDERRNEPIFDGSPFGAGHLPPGIVAPPGVIWFGPIFREPPPRDTPPR
jgi:hypothetical protein